MTGLPKTIVLDTDAQASLGEETASLFQRMSVAAIEGLATDGIFWIRTAWILDVCFEPARVTSVKNAYGICSIEYCSERSRGTIRIQLDTGEDLDRKEPHSLHQCESNTRLAALLVRHPLLAA